MKHFIIALLSLAMLSCSSQRVANNQEVLISGGEERSAGYANIIVYNANIVLHVDIPDSATSQIRKIANNFKGYVVMVGNTSATIRVPAKHLDPAIEKIASLGKVVNKYIWANDFSEEYKDFQTRLDNADRARQRYLELLKQAESIESTLKVEKELERLELEMELLKGKLERLKHLSDYSTITIDVKQKTKPGIVGYVGVGLYKAVRWLFVRN